jgi:hypothetical protein
MDGIRTLFYFRLPPDTYSTYIVPSPFFFFGERLNQLARPHLWGAPRVRRAREHNHDAVFCAQDDVYYPHYYTQEALATRTRADTRTSTMDTRRPHARTHIYTSGVLLGFSSSSDDI